MNDFKQILLAEIISITGGLVAGLLLTSIREFLYLIPGLLVLLPGFLEMRGNISGTLSARLSSALHLGTIKPFEQSGITNANIIASVISTVFTSLALGLTAYLFDLLIGINYPLIILIAIIASLLSGLFMIPITFVSVFFLFKKGIDPDNIMGPYITTVGDVVTTLSLIITVVAL